MRAVEGIDIPAPVPHAGPAGRLHGPAHLQRQLVEPPLEFRGSNLPFARQARQVTVSADIIEPVIVDSDGKPVGQVQDGDAVIFFNFRPDRARQITRTIWSRRCVSGLLRVAFQKRAHPN